MTTLRQYVDAWRATASDIAALAADLDPDDWALPTDCPTWSVHDVLAHCTALEAELAGDPRPRVRVDTSQAHITGPASVYTERGVIAGREVAHDALLAAFNDAVVRRAARLDEQPLDDPGGRPDLTPGDIDWDWQTLLRNRVVDLWVHEQDIRRAVSRPGGLEAPGARVTQETFAAALPYIVARRAKAAPGTSVVVDITGPLPASYGVRVGEDGRGHRTEDVPADPDVWLSMSTETFALLGAGRRNPADCTVSVAGDGDLGRRILADMALTL